MSSSALLSPQFLSRLDSLRFYAKRSFIGTRAGAHRSPKKGHGMEFSDYRRYEQGDNPRLIDWKVFARSERFVVKSYHEEQNLPVLFVLDTSSSMGGENSEGKWKRALELLVASGYIALSEQEEISCVPLGSGRSRKFWGPKSFQGFQEYLQTIVPTLKEQHLVQHFASALQAIRSPGVVLFVTDLLFPLTEIAQCARLLAQSHLDATIIRIEGDSEEDPFSEEGEYRVIDAESGEEILFGVDASSRKAYQEIRRTHFAEARKILLHHDVRLSVVKESEDLFDFLSRSLVSLGVLG